MSQIRILFLAANPKNMGKLDLDSEYETIEEKLRATPNSERFLLQPRWKVGPDRLLELLVMFRPHIVHFSGHGTEDNLVLQDGDGNPWMLERKMARETFRAIRDTAKLVVLNACFSRDVAEDVSEFIDCVIGMALPVRDSSAIAFASALYRGIGSGFNLRESFDQARTDVNNKGLTGPKTPQILTRPGLDPRSLYPLKWLQDSDGSGGGSDDSGSQGGGSGRPIPRDRPGLRKALLQSFLSDADFTAFVVDYFPAVGQRFSAGMDRVARINLLFELISSEKIATALERHLKG